MDIRPVAAADRNLAGIDFFLLWAGVAISLAEIWAGGLLAPMGFRMALWAIVLGHILGNTLMAMGGLIGSDQGITSMVSVRPSFGILGSNLAAVLNVIQLVCWASIMLIIGGRAGAMLGASRGGVLASDSFWIVLIGLGTLFWALLTGRRIWKIMQKAAVVGLTLVLLIMTWETYRNVGSGVAARSASAPMSFMTGLDLVIAMPISWMPLVADYSRFARSSAISFWSTWWGYFLVSSWMFALGLSASLGTGSPEPQMQLLQLMGGIGLLAPALLLVVFSAIVSGFPDIYSATCSVLNVSQKISARSVMFVTGILSILVALVFPMDRYQGFLFFIGAMFVPLFGVALTDYFLARKRRLNLDALDRIGGEYWYWRGYHRTAILAWAAGFITYEAIQLLSYPVGGSIPSMLVAGLLYYLMARRRVRSLIPFPPKHAEAPEAMPWRSETASDIELSLGPNERYRDAILRGASRAGVDAAALAALIGAEAGYYDQATVIRMTDEAFYTRHPELNRRPLTADDKELVKEWKELQQHFAGTWNPDSVSPKSSATGLTQFLKGTWIAEAQRAGTYLNERAREKGYVGDDNRLIPEKKNELLALRTDATLAIVAAADYGRFNLEALAKRGLDSSQLNDTDKAKLMYLAHHEGVEGAVVIRRGTLTDARARVLLAQNVPDEQRRQLLIEKHGGEAKAYVAWLNAYIDQHIQPDRYR